MTSKLLKITRISNYISNGSTIAIGGVHSHNVPMALIREIIRSKINDLTLVGSISAGLPIDILVGAGLVKKVLAPYVGFEMWGLAPQYRSAVQNNKIIAPDVCEAFPVYSLRAASESLPFHPFPPGIHENSSIPSQCDYYKQVTDPFTGDQVYALPALIPDIALIHVQKATRSGAGVHLGSVVTDRLMAEASKLVIMTCDELIEDEDLQSDPSSVTIPAFLVDHVIHLKYAAHPTSSHQLYGYDATELKSYLQACNNEKEYKSYLISRTGIPENQYIEDFVRIPNLGNNARKADIMDTYSPSELIACLLAREIVDGELGICGAVSAIPMTALMLAEIMHAPSMKWIAGGSGYVNPRTNLVPSSTDQKMANGAESRLSMHEVIPLEMDKIDFFFAGGLQIDSRGNANLAGIPSDKGWKLRGPGSVGLPFLARAGRVLLYTENHTSRTLVEQVAYVSGPGHSSGKSYGNGPQVLITDKCVFRWHDDEDCWSLVSIHQGFTEEDIRTNTGFHFTVAENVDVTKAPTKEELSRIREIDPVGYLRGAMD